MKTVIALMFAAALSSINLANAGDQGVINQAGPYEANTKFYMHPAHFYWSSEAPHHNGQHPAVLVKRGDADMTAPFTSMPRHPALEPRSVLLANAPTDN